MEMIIYWTREEATGDLFVWFCFFCCSCCFFNCSSSRCFELLELLELVFELLELAAGATWAKTLQRPSTMGCDCARAVPRYLLLFPLQDLLTLYFIFLYPSSATSSEPCSNWPKICSIWWMKWSFQVDSDHPQLHPFGEFTFDLKSKAHIYIWWSIMGWPEKWPNENQEIQKLVSRKSVLLIVFGLFSKLVSASELICFFVLA